MNSEMAQWRDFLMPYKFALDECKLKINMIKEEAFLSGSYHPIEHVKARIKQPDSILGKLKRKGIDPSLKNAADHLQDVAGIRIVCSFVKDIYLVAEQIEERTDLAILEKKDYIQTPKPNGYQSMHFIAEVPVTLRSGVKKVKVEIQLRTLAMDFWASLEHKIFYKFEREIPDYLKQDLYEAAMAVQVLDQKMEHIRDEIGTIEDSREQILMPL
ncbi:GTP pyrophosphokinase family protein [Metabacillus sp. KIGAM252]|uniref:GTP pyrophosphokinase family protein n=1 Tax=Metabacillus flavus TaxID=2823519 RepID=A0ABS5LEG9_9BACI|nr:GTP pyrophosphokinase family protein [Metabacillus flavus]MBS2968794.1 GTP pyrophosphokinase family protein [Metabacillus flavus]